ncbi:MAG: FAD binding domain-containing protein [Alphaproteobacteria bacterium]
MYTHSTDAGWVSRSHRAISPFRLVRPSTPEEAVDTLSREAGSTLIAGGIDLVRRMRGGDAWGTLIDISSIDGMNGIEDGGTYIRIGALATHWDVETSRLLAEKLPDFQAAWTTIGNVRIRMTGTVGGNLVAQEAGYDGRVILGVLGAVMIFGTAQGQIRIRADDTAAGFPENGLLTAIEIPVAANRKLLLDRSLKPVVSVAVSVEDGRYAIGVGCAFPAPVFQSGAGKIDAETVSASLPEPMGNPMGSAGYRRRMAGVLAARAYRNLANGN